MIGTNKSKKPRSTYRLVLDILLLVLLSLSILIIIIDRYSHKSSKVAGNEAIIEQSQKNEPYIYNGEYDLGSERNPDGILKIRGSNTIVLMDGDHRFSWLSIEQGATVKQKSQSEGGIGLTLRVIYTFRVDENSKIDLVGQGYSVNQAINSALAGRNGNLDNSAGGGGTSVVFTGEAPTQGGNGQGSAGGLGGQYSPNINQPTYVYPGFFGSGGGLAYGQQKSNSGHGGGLLSIFASRFTNLGRIFLNGEDGAIPENNFPGNGGGSGGSLYARVGQFENFGIISANGGRGSIGENKLQGGGGSGGSIIIYFWEAVNQGTVNVTKGEPGGSDGAKLLTRGGGDLSLKSIETLKKIDFDQSVFREVVDKPLIYPYIISQKASEIISTNQISGQNLPREKITIVFGISGDDYIGNDPETVDAVLKIKFSEPISVAGLDDCLYVDERCFILPYFDRFKKIEENGQDITKARSEIIQIRDEETTGLEWQTYDLEPGLVNYYWLTINLTKYNQAQLTCQAQISSVNDQTAGSSREEIDILPNSQERTWSIK